MKHIPVAAFKLKLSAYPVDVGNPKPRHHGLWNLARKTSKPVAISLAALLFTGLFLPVSSKADSIPGKGSVPFFYYSTDMSPVTVDFAYWEYDKARQKWLSGTFVPHKGVREGPPEISVTIPRAYLTLATPYSQKARSNIHKFAVLPDRITSPEIHVDLTYPDGHPYTVMLGNWDKLKPDPTPEGLGKGVEAWSKKDQIRATVQSAVVSLISEGNDSRLNLEKLESLPGYESLPEYEGFRHFARASKEWFFDDGSDDIRAIECYPNLPSRGNIFYCSYYFALNSKLRVELKSIDFRLGSVEIHLELMMAEQRWIIAEKH
jgi:hypothetical protein